jgi:hypothetical protein
MPSAMAHHSFALMQNKKLKEITVWKKSRLSCNFEPIHLRLLMNQDNALHFVGNHLVRKCGRLLGDVTL